MSTGDWLMWWVPAVGFSAFVLPAAELAPLVAAASVVAYGWARTPASGSGAAALPGPHPSEPGPPQHRRLPPWAGGASMAVVVLVAVATFGLGLGAAVALGLAGARAGLGHRLRSRHTAQRDRALPELIDLFAVAASAGHPVHRCLAVVAPRAPEVLAPHLDRATDRLNVGVPLRQVLVDLGEDLGPLAASLVDALTSSLVTGAPLGPALVEVAATARDQRRRDAEILARRLPVQLLVPLVCCVLPAFALLAVVPLLAGSLGDLVPSS